MIKSTMKMEMIGARQFSNEIFLCDEVHFTLGGYVNKKHCRTWGSENSQVIEERPIESRKSYCLVRSLV